MKFTTRAAALSTVALCTLGLAGISIPAAQADVIAPSAVSAAASTLTADEAKILAEGFRAVERYSDGTIHLTISKALFTSKITVAVVGADKYLGGTWGGSATYASVLNENDSTITLGFSGNTVKVGDTVNVYFAKAGYPVTEQQTGGWQGFTTAFSFTAGGVDSLSRTASGYSAHVTAAAHKNMPTIGFDIDGVYAGDKMGETYHYFAVDKAADGYNIGGYLPRTGTTLTAYVPYTIAGSDVQGKVILGSASGTPSAPHAVNAPAKVSGLGEGLSIGSAGAGCLTDGNGGSGYGYECLRFSLYNPLPLKANKTYFDLTLSGAALAPAGFNFQAYWRLQDLGKWQIEGCTDASCATTTVISSAQTFAPGTPLNVDANAAGKTYQSFRFRYLGGGSVSGVAQGSGVGMGGLTEVTVLAN